MKFREGEMQGNKKNSVTSNKRPLPPSPVVKSKEDEITKELDVYEEAVAKIFQFACFGATLKAQQDGENVLGAASKVYKLFQDAGLFE